MENRYLEKLAFKGIIGKYVHAGSGKATYTGAQEAGAPGIPPKKKTHKTTLRMGPHTTPEDLLPNPYRNDMRIR